MMNRFLTLAIAILSLSACAQNTGDEVAPDKAQEMMSKEEVVVLDVRTPDEYTTGHIANAQHIDYYAEDFKQKVGELDKDKTYIVYCRSGARSGKSQAIMQSLGFEKVYNLKGGIMAWHDENKPLTKE